LFGFILDNSVLAAEWQMLFLLVIIKTRCIEQVQAIPKINWRLATYPAHRGAVDRGEGVYQFGLHCPDRAPDERQRNRDCPEAQSGNWGNRQRKNSRQKRPQGRSGDGLRCSLPLLGRNRWGNPILHR